MKKIFVLFLLFGLIALSSNAFSQTSVSDLPKVTEVKKSAVVPTNFKQSWEKVLASAYDLSEALKSYSEQQLQDMDNGKLAVPENLSIKSKAVHDDFLVVQSFLPPTGTMINALQEKLETLYNPGACEIGCGLVFAICQMNCPSNEMCAMHCQLQLNNCVWQCNHPQLAKLVKGVTKVATQKPVTDQTRSILKL